MSDPGLQHARLPCPSPAPGACSNSCPSIQWCPLSSCLQFFPASGSFPMSQFSASGGQSIRASDTASVLPKNNLGWFPLGLTGLISLQSKGLLKSLLQYHTSKASILQCSAFLIVQLSHSYKTTEKKNMCVTFVFSPLTNWWTFGLFPFGGCYE